MFVLESVGDSVNLINAPISSLPPTVPSPPPHNLPLSATPPPYISPLLPSYNQQQILENVAQLIHKGARKKFAVVTLDSLIDFTLLRPELEFYLEIKKVLILHFYIYLGLFSLLSLSNCNTNRATRFNYRLLMTWW